jgi:hypothetical protein
MRRIRATRKEILDPRKYGTAFNQAKFRVVT